MINQYLILYGLNVAVKGEKRAAIYCLEKDLVYIIPLTFYDLLKLLEKEPFQKVKKRFADQEDVFDSYIDFILKNSIGFFTDEPGNFPRLNIEYFSPEIITSANVQYAGLYPVELLVDQLNKCNCKYLRIDLVEPNISTRSVSDILEETFASTLRAMEIIFNDITGLTEKKIEELVAKYPKLSSMIICDCPKFDLKYYKGTPVYKLGISMNEMYEKNQLKNLLVVDLSFFIESHCFNPYYNKKVFIDKSGIIKNAFDTNEEFGNIKTDQLADVVSKPEFQKLWKTIPKHIKDSELKYCIYNPQEDMEISGFKNCKIINPNYDYA